MNKLLLSIFTILFISIASIAGAATYIEGPGDKNPTIKSYPNPVSTDLTIDIQLAVNNYNKAEVKIVNLLGQEIIPTVKVDLEGLNNTIKIDCREIPAGFYFMEVTTSASDGTSYTYTKKITKT